MLPPYLLYLGNCQDPVAAKTARGLAHWRPERCVGQLRGPTCTVDLGLPDLALEDARTRGARTLVIGVANSGGIIPVEALQVAVDALALGFNVASGLHERLASHPRLVEAALAAGTQLFDVRQPPDNLPVGTGAPRKGHRLLTVGTDCSVGKMYTSLAIERALRSRDIPADFRATGQTGILIASGGVPIDAVVSDFLSGAVEWLTPPREDDGWDIIEGQGSLFHPSYAGVSLGLLHGAQAEALVLCHDANRRCMRHLADYAVPDLRECLDRNLDAARLVNPRVAAIGVALNTNGMSPEAAEEACRKVEAALDLPCQDPVAHGVDRIVENLLSCAA